MRVQYNDVMLRTLFNKLLSSYVISVSECFIFHPQRRSFGYTPNRKDNDIWIKFDDELIYIHYMFPGPGYHHAEDGVAWLWYVLVNLYIDIDTHKLFNGKKQHIFLKYFSLSFPTLKTDKWRKSLKDKEATLT